ncbi:MAG: type I restriction-modification enzyme R subunit C-terminal domain-containing protein, partial [Actinomycetota bacterium]|nr:type I restriction-modification enzyme R subunit C-terminal domain-containing protein [Actinomycetota bacterium]
QTREERADRSKNIIFTQYTSDQQVFLDFVLAEYVKEGVGELDQDKLPDLLELKYGGVREGVQQLGDQNKIREIFTDFQQFLYVEENTA